MAFVVLLCAAGAHARVIRVVVEKRESPAFGGQLFGKAGAYEILSGRFYGEVDPGDPHNSIINDIQFAPRNARGMVEYDATFTLSKPVDMSKSNGILYYTVPNRGRGAAVGSPDGRDIVKAAAEKAVAERFLLREAADRLIAEATANDVMVEKR